MPIPLPPLLSSLELRERLGLAVDTYLLGVFGVLNHSKNPVAILDAVQRLITDEVPVQIVFIGQENDTFHLMAEVEQRGLGDLLRRAHPPVDRLAGQVIQPFVDIPSRQVAPVQPGPQHGRIHRPRQDGIYPDVIFGELDGDRPGEGQQAALAGGIGGNVRLPGDQLPGSAVARFIRDPVIVGIGGTRVGMVNILLIAVAQTVAVGSSGGITMLGTLVALGGALLIGGLAFAATEAAAFFPTWFNSVSGAAFLVPIAGLSGLLGSLFDSFLGATVQAIYYCDFDQKETESARHRCGRETRLVRGWRWLSNDWVNLFASVMGSAIAAALYWVIQPI